MLKNACLKQVLQNDRFGFIGFEKNCFVTHMLKNSNIDTYLLTLGTLVALKLNNIGTLLKSKGWFLLHCKSAMTYVR